MARGPKLSGPASARNGEVRQQRDCAELHISVKGMTRAAVASSRAEGRELSEVWYTAGSRDSHLVLTGRD